ncbi:hypothetical protein FHX82_004456 [Amycolatopsis bartoniae]|uniref:Uncharacterized protein n=1 Tax=Amycolatopsis bartoniae TaxID=941986 RepID=A0A8H9J2L5_9PSEU|nr:hypothetical protein [Amycolatopsis bartoniae]MBB2937383.1 hypothetical protein [Amycolatopsis bartoniae]GHF78603.1 hypothetical protein GCM10017566_61150 [Amycolatopsis bartoniae]
MDAKRAPRSVLLTALLAAIVTVGALVGVAAMRAREDRPREAAPVPPVSAQPGTDCGDGPCKLLATRTVGAGAVELLADAQGANGRFQADGQVVQTSITELGGRLDPDSLTCVAASVSACLVSAPFSGGELGELVVQRDGDWRAVAKPYFSDAGVIELGNVANDDAPEVVVVQSSPALARVYALDGSVVGCTRKYSYPAQLRGWPQVRVLASDLRACP